MSEIKNLCFAFILTAIVLIGWQFFYEKQNIESQTQTSINSSKNTRDQNSLSPINILISMYFGFIVSLWQRKLFFSYYFSKGVLPNKIFFLIKIVLPLYTFWQL